MLGQGQGRRWDNHRKGEAMPKALEEKLRREAEAKGLGKERMGAYIYGTMQKVTDWKPGKHMSHAAKKMRGQDCQNKT